MNSSSVPSSRDDRIDALRGLFLVLMAVNHIPSELHRWTDHSLGFFSSAEGFFFLSGLLAGRVYLRRWERDGAAATWRAAWKRAGVIYAAHLATLAAVIGWIHGFHAATGAVPGHAPTIIVEHPWLAGAAAVVLRLQPALFDILPLYAGFMLLLPALLWCYERRAQGAVLAASAAVWLLGFAFAKPIAPDAFATHSFPWAAWQWPLVAGSVCGSLWAQRRLGADFVRAPWVALAALIVAWCFLVRHAYVPAFLPTPLLEALASKNFLGPLRVVNVVAVFYLLWAAAARWRGFLRIAPLEFLGKHTLPVFCAHVLAAYVIYAFPGTFDRDPAARWLGTGFMLAVMFAAAGLHARYRTAHAAMASRSAVPSGASG